MPLPSSLVGATTDARTTPVDLRWTMAFAAGIDDTAPCYLGTVLPPGAPPAPVVAHPLFAVCVEWPVVLDARRLALIEHLTPDEAVRGVHATHDLVVHRLIRPGDVLTTSATVERIERRRPGAYQVLRLDTTDAAGDPVATTRMGTLFLGVDVDGDDRRVPAEHPSPPEDGPVVTAHRALGRGAAHVYTECARIWNPIHTDVAAARATGLPDIILHGTATLAMAVSAIVAHDAGGDPARIRRIAARFGAVVRLPSTLEIRVRPQGAGPAVGFEVLTEHGEPAIRDGVVELTPG